MQIYANSFSSDRKTITKTELLEFFTNTKEYLEHTIKANKRADNLYHSYNLMTLVNDSEVAVTYLPEMLEGQVAVLSAGYLSSKEALEVLDGMKKSALFREDQYSYILYPNKELPRFDQKNVIADSAVKKSELLSQLVQDQNTQIINKDISETYHFNANFNNANSLQEAFENLPKIFLPNNLPRSSCLVKETCKFFFSVSKSKTFVFKSEICNFIGVVSSSYFFSKST